MKRGELLFEAIATMQPQKFQTLLALFALLVTSAAADERPTPGVQKAKAISTHPQTGLALPETRQSLRYTPLMGASFSTVDALLKTKLKDWTRSDYTSTSEIGSVTYESDGITLSLWFKAGKFTGFAIGSTATDAARSERRHREVQDALQVASDEASIPTGSDAAPASDLARFQKLHFDALIKEGFTRDDALRIIAATPAPASSGPAPVPSRPARAAPSTADAAPMAK